MSWLRDNPALAGVFIVFSALSVHSWFELATEPDYVAAPADHDPDYVIENLISTTIQGNRRQYRVIADRLAHYPAMSRSLLSNPQVIQYESGRVLSHVHAEKGWIDDDRSTVSLDGNVRVAQGHNEVPGSVATSDKMTINLNR